MKQKKSSDKMNSILAAGMIVLLVSSISAIRFFIQAFTGLYSLETALGVGMTLAEDTLLCILAGLTYQRFKTVRGTGRNSTVNTYFLGMVFAGSFIAVRGFCMVSVHHDLADGSFFWDEYILGGAAVFLAGVIFSSSLIIKRNILPEISYFWFGVIWFSWTLSCFWIFMEVAFSSFLDPANDLLAGVIPLIWLAVPVAIAVISDVIHRRKRQPEIV